VFDLITKEESYTEITIKFSKFKYYCT